MLRSWTRTRPSVLFWYTCNDFLSDKHGGKIVSSYYQIDDGVKMCAKFFVFLHICGCMRGHTGDAKKCWQDIDCKIEMHKNIKDHEASNIKVR